MGPLPHRSWPCLRRWLKIRWKYSPEQPQPVIVTTAGKLRSRRSREWYRTTWEDRKLTDLMRLGDALDERSAEHPSALQSLMRISYAVYFLLQHQQLHNTISH